MIERFVMYKAKEDIMSRLVVKKIPKKYCSKGDILMPLYLEKPIIVATKKEMFSVTQHQIEPVMMNPKKLIASIKEVFSNPVMTLDKFPYDFITGLTEGKEWEKDFIQELKLSDTNEALKSKILEKYETIDL
jgi:hypothetical protein